MSSVLDRPSPFNIEAERCVLGSLLLDASAIDRVRALVPPTNFYREMHQWVAEAIYRLHDRGEEVDSITLADELERLGRLKDVGGRAGVSELSLVVPTALHAEHYARIVERNAVRRRMLGAAERIARLAYEREAEEVDDVIAEADRVWGQAIQRSATTRQGTSFGEGMDLVAERVRHLAEGTTEVSGLPVSLPSLRRLTRSWRRGAVYVIGARTNVGKSLLAWNETIELAQKGYRCLWIGYEMGVEAMAARGIAHLANLDSVQVTEGFSAREDLAVGPDGARLFPRRATSEEMLQAAIQAARERWRDLPITIVGTRDDDPSVQPPRAPHEARAFIKQHAGRVGTDFIVVDYLGLMDLGSRLRAAEKSDALGDAMLLLLNTAKEVGAALWLIHQIGRDAARSGRPSLYHFDASRHIENHADGAILIHDEYKASEGQRGVKGHKELIVPKHRHGPTGIVTDVRVDEATGRWWCEAPDYLVAQAETWNGHDRYENYDDDEILF